MNINRMTDEELAKEVIKFYKHENDDIYFDWSNLVEFIRQCVKDSQKELVDALEYVEVDKKAIEMMLEQKIKNCISWLNFKTTVVEALDSDPSTWLKRKDFNDKEKN